MNTSRPPLSVGVVIPGHNFSRNLEWTLEALAPQLSPCDRVVIADDHSTDAIRPENLRHLINIDVVHLTGGDGPGNRSAARNAGWRRCQTDVILFLDGDMIPGPNCLTGIRELHTGEPGIVVKVERFALSRACQRAGKRRCLRMIAQPERWLGEGDCQIVGGAASARGGPVDRTDRWYFAASNAVSVERPWVEKIGGWDEGYIGWGEEDMDFAYRLHLAGVAFVFPPAGRLYAVHLDHRVPRCRLDSLMTNARRFVTKFPEVYEMRLPAYSACGLPREGLAYVSGGTAGENVCVSGRSAVLGRIGLSARQCARRLAGLLRGGAANWTDTVYYAPSGARTRHPLGALRDRPHHCRVVLSLQEATRAAADMDGVPAASGGCPDASSSPQTD